MQHVILYDNAEGQTQVYTTAYTERQINDGIVRCFYGRGEANVRALPADEAYAAYGTGEPV